jgi:hypothetical protein
MADGSGDSSFIRGARWVERAAIEYWPTLFIAIAGVGWVFAKDFVAESPLEETWPHFAVRIVVAIALTSIGVAGAVGAYKRSGEIRALKDDVRSLQASLDSLTNDTREAWRLRLAEIYGDLELDGSFRINLYRFSRQTRVFNMIGRYARIEQYNQTGRGVYPAQIGCIGAAWESADGEAWVDDLPDPSDAEYVRLSCERWGFDEDTVRALTMKSRSIYAFAIWDQRNVDRIAIIVFESLNSKAADAERLRQAVRGRIGQRIVTDLETLKFIEPSPDLAKEKGF